MERRRGKAILYPPFLTDVAPLFRDLIASPGPYIGPAILQTDSGEESSPDQQTELRSPPSSSEDSSDDSTITIFLPSPPPRLQPMSRVRSSFWAGPTLEARLAMQALHMELAAPRLSSKPSRKNQNSRNHLCQLRTSATKQERRGSHPSRGHRQRFDNCTRPLTVVPADF